MLFLNENAIDTAMLKNLAIPLQIYTIKDSYEINKIFNPLLRNIIKKRKYKLMNKSMRENERCLKTLAGVGADIPRHCKIVNIYCFMYILETAEYSIPMLVIVDKEFDDIIAGYVLMQDSRGVETLKIVGVNNTVSKTIIKDIIQAIKKSI